MGRPNLPNRKVFDKYVDRIFDKRWLTNNGPLVREFQEKLEEFLQVKHCIPICNGTIALEITERALGFVDDVVLPSYTFIATAHSLQWQRIRPVFADIGEYSVTINPRSIKQVLTPNTNGIIGVHVYGHPCDHKAICGISKQHNIRVIYDAAHAFGCEVNGVPIASIGDASIFSFHATKFFHTFEGGIVATNDSSLAREIFLMTNFGFTGNDDVSYLGINGKMTEIAAAMGLSMLDSIESIRSKNLANYQYYKTSLSEIDGLEIIEPPSSLSKNNWQYVIAKLDEKEFGISRDLTVEALKAENIFARRYFYPGCHRLYPYRTCRYKNYSLRNTENLADQVISFPTGQSVNESDIKRIAQLLHLIKLNKAKLQKIDIDYN